MTSFAKVHKMLESEQLKSRVTSLHAHNGTLEVRYADKTIEIFKSNWRGKLKVFKERG